MKRVAVVLSQGQSQNPVKRQLEEDIVTNLMLEPGIDVTVIPHLYDLHPEGTGMLALQGISGHVIVLSWLFYRAAHWTLDRNGIHGQLGISHLITDDEDDDGDENSPDVADKVDAVSKQRVADGRPTPKRRIYCLELRAGNDAQTFIDEIRRIANDLNTPLVQLGGWLGGTPRADQLARFANPTNDTALDVHGVPASAPSGNGNGATARSSDGNGADGERGTGNGSEDERLSGEPALQRIEETAGRRWYPVIDYSRCTNCMECIDFCLFGVYGVDRFETILVEQPDNCRKGCPACSRVCPENAIIFPQHKTPAIAGAPAEASTLKIDLSKLFGAPDAMDVAAQERDEQLVLAGRDAVGLPKRQAELEERPKDDIDSLLDELDSLDL